MNKKVVIGLSGGIDSSMAALLLKERGFDVYGLHFSFDEEKYAEKINIISNQLDIPISILDIKDDFKKVKQHFVDEYLKGRTPSPCTYCNRIIKWKKLLEFADKNSFDFVSSGHYVRQIERDGFSYLQKGLDPVKDQSYFLWELDSKTIRRMINPLGEFSKTQVRELATKYGFHNLVKKKESMGVCFLKNMDYRTFIQKNYPNEITKIKEGKVKDESGNIIGTHEGYIYYTIGQKRGLDLKINEPACVKHIDPVKNELVVCAKKSLEHYNIKLRSLHLINPECLNINSEVTINIRGYGLNPEEPALVKNITRDGVELKLKKPAWAVAPGQPIVFYEKDVVLGGGIAEESW